MSGADRTEALQGAVAAAHASGTPVQILGGGTKTFYGREPRGVPLSLAGHTGIVSYEPTELVISARSATPLAEIEAVLAANRQMLAFEPPHFGPGATLGGCVASGISGPRRPYGGAVRDHVLGVRLLNGKGEVLRFGGEVMKNVAGYDVSRLMTGAMGTLGVLLEVSLKVLPRPAVELTLRQSATVGHAIEAMGRWAGHPLPVSAAAFDGESLYLRLSGAESGVRAARGQIGGELVADGEGFWERLREHRHAFFASSMPLWRLSVPPAAPALDLPGKSLLDWGGAQRWLLSDAPASKIREAAAGTGGHACLFRGADRQGEVFHPLAPALEGLHRNLKRAFDPAGILNPGRLYAGL
jgi:glycolate oxidase FAD binding subunit